ncbi:hypothetical protein SK355_00180 [Candidatus Fukatsuia symbiotica]|uniref:Uncharacterized protein n=2 Tax=Candidatus Fukatsuia symbiotica TaxID=1878942 RepID=A0A2U8IA68_9GAMM|nr:hypothetical protein [Candidatus Fukatsuia symbiotica]AWK14994.1 hypothetical protein CCS41_11770 [Candidatus Fukatsuia symbiotica]MEA9443786.1 hypothetical protein [Candidatus Fukatsuia symbiotica]
MQHGLQLHLLIGTQWLVINDAFTPGKASLSQVKFSFQQYETDLQKLVDYCRQTSTEENNRIRYLVH